jgi:c-di-GMP-binding flagellar brake protein YcgR
LRVPLDAPVRAETIPQASPSRVLQLPSEDLSAGGARLSSPEFLLVDTRVLMDLDPLLPNEPIRAIGRVVWVERVPYAPQWRVGGKFDELSKSTRAQLRRIVVRQEARD